MSILANPFAGPAQFKAALMAGLGNEARGDIAPGAASGRAAPRPCDPALLRRVEAMLAAHVGPIARLLVQRSAVGCDDVATLCERLAESVTRPAGAGAAGASREAPRDETETEADVAVAPGPIPDALVEASARVLAGSLGPIARVVARRAAGTAVDRAAYFGALEAALDDPRKRRVLRVQLEQLGPLH